MTRTSHSCWSQWSKLKGDAELQRILIVLGAIWEQPWCSHRMFTHHPKKHLCYASVAVIYQKASAGKRLAPSICSQLQKQSLPGWLHKLALLGGRKKEASLAAFSDPVRKKLLIKKSKWCHAPPTSQDTALPLTKQGLEPTTSAAGDRQRICKTFFFASMT